MKPLPLIIFLSTLALLQGFTLQLDPHQNPISSNPKIEEFQEQPFKPKSIKNNAPKLKQQLLSTPRLLQTYNIASLNNFISSLSGQLYYPVTSTGTSYNYGQSNANSYGVSGAAGALPASIPAPPTFNLETPQTITGFGPETATTPTSVTYVNASEILSVLGSNSNNPRASTSTFNGQNTANNGYQQYPQNTNNQNQWQGSNQNNNYFSWGGDSQGGSNQQQQQQQQTTVYQFDVGGGSSNRPSGGSYSTGGVSSLNGLNITQLLSSGLDQDQIAQILATQAQIINRNNNPVNLVPQPVNVTSFLNQQQQQQSSSSSAAGGGGNLVSGSRNQGSTGQQSLGSFNYSQASTVVNTTNVPQNVPAGNLTSGVISVNTNASTQIRPVQTTQVQNITTTIINNTQSPSAAAQQQEAQRLALLQQQQQQAQRLALLQQQQQQQQQSQQPNISTVTSVVTTTNTTRPSESITTISNADIQRIIQLQEQQLRGFITQNTTTQNQVTTQTNPGLQNSGFSQVSSTNIPSAPASTVFANIGTTNQVVAVPNQPAIRNVTTTTTTTTTTTNQTQATQPQPQTPIQTTTTNQVQFCTSYNLNFCVSCQSGYYLIQGLCYSASTTQGCSVFSQSQCIICMSGYYMYQSQCFRVDQRCNNFDYNNKVCVVCATGTNPRGTGCA